MKRSHFTFVLVLITGIFTESAVFAQNSGGSSGLASGDMNLTDTSGVAMEAPTLDRTNVSSFPGYPTESVFIGREQSFETSFSRESGGTTATTRSTRRTTTMARPRTNMAMTGRMGSANNGRVRAVTTTDFQFAPPEIDFRTASLREKMVRLPSLKLTHEQIGIQLTEQKGERIATLTGTVATTKERRLLQNLLILEPGVDRVDNRLKIGGQ